FLNGGSDKKNDLQFQSVSGLNVQLETETVKEGGENRFEHVLPSRSKFSDLIFKRGIMRPEESDISDWFLEAFQNLIIIPKNLQVKLLDELHSPLMYWNIIHAWPKNWKVADLNAERGEILIETMELNFNRFEFKK